MHSIVIAFILLNALRGPPVWTARHGCLAWDIARCLKEFPPSPLAEVLCKTWLLHRFKRKRRAEGRIVTAFKGMTCQYTGSWFTPLVLTYG